LLLERAGHNTPLRFSHAGAAAGWQLLQPWHVRLSCEASSRLTRSEVRRLAPVIGPLSHGFSEARGHAQHSVDVNFQVNQ